jgi:hypothetical protein
MVYIQINGECSSLKELLSSLDRKIKLSIRNKYYGEFYQVDSVFCQNKYSDMLIYRQILENLMYNPFYFCNQIDTEKITSKIKQLIK